MASLSPGSLVAFGVVVGLISTCVQSVGLTLQRKSHILEEEKESHLPRRAPYRRRRWQIGMFLFLLSNIVGSSIQITTLPLPLLSTLQASGLVFNAALASLLLHEPFTRRTLLGTVLVAGGALLISFFSALPEPSHTLPQLLALLVAPAFILWMSLTLLLVLLILVLTSVASRFLPPHRLRSPRTRLLRGMAYGLVSGVLSAHALLLAKSAVELLVRTIVDKHNQFNAWESWMLLLLFLFLALTQLYYLHHGLRLVSTSILYPFVFCVYNIIAILDGLIYFRQTDRLKPIQGGLIALGTVVLLTGVLALSWRLSEEGSADGFPDENDKGLRADLPHSALTPGMGLVDEETNDVHTPLQSYFDDPDGRYEGDDGLSPSPQFPDLLTDETGATERDPLLRKPVGDRNTGKHKRGSSAAASSAQARREAIYRRRRRSTIKEVQMVWDELRDERNWFPPSRSNRTSPRPPSRYRDEEGASVGGEERDGVLRCPSTERKRVSWQRPEGDTPTRTIEERRRMAGENRRTAPPAAYTFEGVMGALRGARARRPVDGMKRTVSWGQGSNLGEDIGAAVDEAGARPVSADPRGHTTGHARGLEGEGGEEDGGIGRGGGRVASAVRSPSGTSEGSEGDSSGRGRRRRSWGGSVKLDWWRKRRRDEGSPDGQ